MDFDGVSILDNESLARHSPFRTGGCCAQWAVVHRREALVPLLDHWAESGQRYSVMGSGTKTVYRDGGVDHAVFRLGSGFQASVENDAVWTLGAALPLVIARYRLMQAGVDPFHEFGGVSGTVGGLFATADDVVWERLLLVTDAVETVSRKGFRWRDMASLKSPPKLITSVRLKPMNGLPNVTGEFRCSRGRSHWFHGPGDRGQKRQMIQRVSMAGARLHGVLMPENAPELLVNIGGGTSRDYWELHRSVLDRVSRFHGVTWSCGLKWQGRK